MPEHRAIAAARASVALVAAAAITTLLTACAPGSEPSPIFTDDSDNPYAPPQPWVYVDSDRLPSDAFATLAEEPTPDDVLPEEFRSFLDAGIDPESSRWLGADSTQTVWLLTGTEPQNADGSGYRICVASLGLSDATTTVGCTLGRVPEPGRIAMLLGLPGRQLAVVADGIPVSKELDDWHRVAGNLWSESPR